jgi:NodT family efflux transporter outer membrane factor (OMF) lipoprotein
VPRASRGSGLGRSPGPGPVLALTLGLGLAGLAGCAVGPDFRRPETEVPAEWAGSASAPAARPLTSAEQELAVWWTAFQDPVLTSLVERAVRSNLDLKQAEARIRQARAARRISVSGLGPSLDAEASYRRSRAEANLSGGADGAGARTEAGAVDQYQAGFDAAWEADLFGGVRRGVEAADADLQAAVEDRRAVLVTLTAEVARNYIELRTFQERVGIARKNLQAQEQSARLTRTRFEGGFASGLDVANAEALAATTAAQMPVLEASARRSIYSLSLLLGREPAALLEELSPASSVPFAPPSVPAGLPSDLLRRRPDIRRAEAEIHAATARIGVATADLFPRFTISGSLGLRATDFSSWFEASSRFWSIGPSLNWRLFETGRVRAEIEQRKALEEQALLAYRQTVLTALREVEDALVTSAKEQDHRKALLDAVAANRRAVELATTLYTEGQTDFLNVLEPQRSLFVSEDAVAQSTQTLSTNLAALYKALGGGWSDPEAPRQDADTRRTRTAAAGSRD